MKKQVINDTVNKIISTYLTNNNVGYDDKCKKYYYIANDKYYSFEIENIDNEYIVIKVDNRTDGIVDFFDFNLDKDTENFFNHRSFNKIDRKHIDVCVSKLNLINDEITIDNSQAYLEAGNKGCANAVVFLSNKYLDDTVENIIDKINEDNDFVITDSFIDSRTINKDDDILKELCYFENEQCIMHEYLKGSQYKRELK